MQTNKQSPLGRLIQGKRRSMGLKVETVAEQTQLSVGTIRAIEQGRRMPSATSLKKVLPVLDLAGVWVGSTTWQYNELVVELAAYPGYNGVKGSCLDQDNIRVEVMRKILDADAETLKFVHRLLSS